MKFSHATTAAAFLTALHALTTLRVGIRSVDPPPARGRARHLSQISIPKYRKIEATVIVVGYNRPESLRRLLTSLERTVVPEESLVVHVKVCLDGSDAATYDVASSFMNRTKWYNGRFALFQRGENFGLARHIASCWDRPRDREWALLLEDDVVASPRVFEAFVQGLRARSAIRGGLGPAAVQGIAMHGQRVNQYCWTKYVRRNECPAIREECGTRDSVDSILGALMCPDVAYAHPRGGGGGGGGGDWIGTQLPSSWGAFYTGRSWATFQRYFAAWQRLTDAQRTALELPLSMSNEWGASWKRPFAELMHALGWTLLYRAVPRQASLVVTKRDDGVHVTRNSSGFEDEKRCLIVLPSEENVNWTRSDADSIAAHLDYCSHPIEDLEVLQRRGAAHVRRMVELYDGPDDGDDGDGHPLRAVVRVLRDATPKRRLSERVPGRYAPAHGTLDRTAAAEVVLVTTTHEVNREFRGFCKQILGQDRVKFVVVGPPKVCVHLRNHEAAHCLPEKQFVGKDSRLPVVTKMIQGGLEAAIPNVTQFVGVVNSDIVFRHDSLMATLASVKDSASCARNCVVVGRRYDVDWTTKEEKLHSDWGMDFFIFNVRGARYAVENMPPMVVGRTRWDSYFMGHFAMSPHMEVIDATDTLRADHGMAFTETRASHTHDDLTNHKLVTEVFQWGRIGYSNHKTTKEGGLEVHRRAQDVAKEFAVHHEKFKFDLFFEKMTNFTYSPNGLFPFVTCFCALLERPPKQFCESPTLIGREVKKRADDKSFVLPHAALKSFLPLKDDASFETIRVASKSAPHNKCCVAERDLPMISRPRPAKMLDQDYRDPFDVRCLRGRTFPFLSDSELKNAAQPERPPAIKAVTEGKVVAEPKKKRTDAAAKEKAERETQEAAAVARKKKAVAKTSAATPEKKEADAAAKKKKTKTIVAEEEAAAKAKKGADAAVAAESKEKTGVVAAESEEPIHVVQFAKGNMATSFQYQAICLSLLLKLENSSSPDVRRRLKCQFVPKGDDVRFVPGVPRVVQSYDSYKSAPFDSYVKQRTWVFTTVCTKDQVKKKRADLERAGYANIIYIQDLETVAEKEHHVVDNYSQAFGLNSRQRNELLEYMRYWNILHLCCGKRMSHKWRMEQQRSNGTTGEDFVDVHDPMYPACSTYNIDEVERKFLGSFLYQKIVKLGMDGVGKVIKAMGHLDGSYCSQYNQMVRSGEVEV